MEKNKGLIPNYDGFYYECKNCNNLLGTNYKCEEPNYCSKCGQKINWEFNIEFDCIVE